MADYVAIVLEDGTEVLFQSAEGDLVQSHGGESDIERYEEAMTGLQALAAGAGRLSRTFRDHVNPDELQLEIGVGLSGEVGWFFAKTELEATIKLTLTWRRDVNNPGIAG